MSDYDYSDGDEPILRRILQKVGLWTKPDLHLPPPIGRSTGAGRKSRVYFVFIGEETGGHGRFLVAKFDEDSRRRQEWKALRELSKIDTPLEMLLPISGNEPGDGALVFQAAQGIVRHLRCVDLLEVFVRQVEHNPESCVHALELALDVLSGFYDGEPGAAQLAQNGRLVTWADEFKILTRDGSHLLQASLSTAGRDGPHRSDSILAELRWNRGP